MTKILFLANCQGFSYNNFLRTGSESYVRDWHFLKTIQAHLIKDSDAPFLLEQMEQADVIVAQPLLSVGIEEMRPTAIRGWTERKGKQLIVVPALQYDALMFGMVPSLWPDVPSFPFAANEHMLFAAAYICGLSAKEAAELYQDAALLTGNELRGRVEAGISAFKEREKEAGADIIASDYYAQHWRTSSLHFAKGHPLPEVMRHFTGALAEKLGISDFDPARTGALKGAFGHCMPIPRWVKAALELEFEIDHDTICSDEKYMPLEDFIQTMFDWYDVQGRAEVERRAAQNRTYAIVRNAITPFLGGKASALLRAFRLGAPNGVT
ncbi:WcbI family polysaccharide biosynthesis putative acetyltransferase [Pseudophaeobacter sp.]|uniref:WcbI family polysaccharide biosynthesis putative acetyltransferase n=1 Tax=Pseudophaeobacter sp. TaxID=1971739 RepID=UPI0032974ED9